MEKVSWPPEKRKFMARFERHEPVLQDHTAMNCFDVCDRKYFYQIVLGRRPKRSNYQVVLDAGNIYHKFREIIEREYNRCRNCNSDKFTSVCLPTCSGYAPQADPESAGAKGLMYVVKAPLDVPPENSKYSYLDRTTLLKCCKFAYEHWIEEKRLGTIKIISIEQPFNLQLSDGSFTSGRADQIIRSGLTPWGRDFKFTSKNEEMFKRGIEPNDQGTRYIYSESKLIGERLDGIIFEALHHSFTKSRGLELRIVNHLSQRTESQLQAWLADKIHINRQKALNTEHDHWPMRTHNCSWCDFASVCRKTNENSMMAELENNYELRPWDHSVTTQDEL